MSQEKDWLEKMLADIKKVPVDCQKGLKAYNAGDYSTALSEFIPLAEAGNVIAQYNLGIMYGGVKGVTQNYAASWMTSAQFVEAKEMSRQCLARNYKGC